MKRFTEYKPLSDRQAFNIKEMHTQELFMQRCPHNVAVELAEIYVETLEKRAKQVNWPTYTLYKMEKKYNNSDDLSKPLH